ncbi:MAG: hypothetical protein M3Z21_04130 [Pseudomonadota bacterium]|nr:hypothetical protein [Pseudomonadota bacterium]
MMKNKIAVAIAIALFAGAAWAAEEEKGAMQGAPETQTEQQETSPNVEPLPSQTPAAGEQTLVKEGAPMDVPEQHETSPTVEPLPSQTAGAEGGMEKKMDLQALDADDDGYVSESEAGTWPELAGRFGELDANGDGQLDEGEFSKFEMEMHGSIKEGAPADMPVEHGTGTATQ